jgi:hypothetical protein
MATSRASNGFDHQIQKYIPTGAYHGTYQPFLTGQSAQPVHIPAFQAFMVHKTQIGGLSTWPFFQSERVTTQDSLYRFNKQGTNGSLKLYLSGNGFNDMTEIAFHSAATVGFDPEFDADKFHSDKGQPTLYTISPSYRSWMGINTLPELLTTQDVALGLEPGADGSFTLSIDSSDHSHFDPSADIYLEDKKTNNPWINIRAAGAYTFTAAQTDNWERFVLHFVKSAAGIKDPVTDAVKIFASGSKVVVDLKDTKDPNATVKVYDTEGRLLSSEVMNSSIYTQEIATTGCVIVNVTTSNGQTFRSKVTIIK